ARLRTVQRKLPRTAHSAPGPLAFRLTHNLFRLRLRDFLVVTELHAVDRATLAHRAQGRRVPEHLGQGHARGHDLRVGTLRHAADLAAPRREIADDVAHVISRRD